MNNNKISSSSQSTEENSSNNRGKIFQRYNIVAGKIENYLIPADKVEAYRKAVFHQDLDAHKKLGARI